MEDCSISFNHTIILHYYTTLYSLESLTLLIRYEYLKNNNNWKSVILLLFRLVLIVV